MAGVFVYVGATDDRGQQLMTTPTSRRPAAETPLAVWPVTQTTSQYQRHNRYAPDSAKHPGKMVPALARKIIDEYSQPGSLVVDPMAGIGTTIVEGASLGRYCIGIDLEQQWVDIAKQNVACAVEASRRENADMRVGNAQQLPAALGSLARSVDLIATSPPYACEVATVNKKGWQAGGRIKASDGLNYSDNRSNLGHARGKGYEDEMVKVYQACFDALRPGGLFVTVTKNMRRRNNLVDLVETTVRLATSVGFGYLQHNVALLCAVRDGGLIARPSFWQTSQLRHARSRGIPQHLVCHEDVLVFVRPQEAANA